MAGADQIFASNHPCLEYFPLHTAILRMIRSAEDLPETDAALFPVTEQTLDTWLELYNRRMTDVPNASYMDSADGKSLLRSGDGYFVHKDGLLLGIGKASGNQIDAVVSAQSGMGETVVLALASALKSDTVQLIVAEANTRAVRLYERMGFEKTEEVCKWFRVI